MPLVQRLSRFDTRGFGGNEELFRRRWPSELADNAARRFFSELAALRAMPLASQPEAEDGEFQYTVHVH